jgi:hypothetical protein
MAGDCEGLEYTELGVDWEGGLFFEVNAFTQLTQRCCRKSRRVIKETLQEIEGRPKRDPHGMGKRRDGLTLHLYTEDIETLFALLIPVDFLRPL